MKRPGYQLLKAQPYEALGRACMSVTIELRGLQFSGVAELTLTEPGDPFQAATRRAIDDALTASAQSDFVSYARTASWSGKGGSGKPKAEPNATASAGAIGGMFKAGLQEHGYKRPEIQDLIAELLQLPYIKDLENELTNAQVDTLKAKLAAGERAQNPPRLAYPSQHDALKRAAAARGMSETQLIRFLEKQQLRPKQLTAQQVQTTIEQLQKGGQA